MTTLLIPAVALPAWHTLSRSLVGYQPPCQANPDLWQSTEPDAVQAAASGCRRCRVLALCGAYADAARESTGVWAGISREPPRNPQPTEENTT